jgi:hypothetical protein
MEVLATEQPSQRSVLPPTNPPRPPAPSPPLPPAPAPPPAGVVPPCAPPAWPPPPPIGGAPAWPPTPAIAPPRPPPGVAPPFPPVEHPVASEGVFRHPSSLFVPQPPSATANATSSGTTEPSVDLRLAARRTEETEDSRSCCACIASGGWRSPGSAVNCRSRRGGGRARARPAIEGGHPRGRACGTGIRHRITSG